MKRIIKAVAIWLCLSLSATAAPSLARAADEAVDIGSAKGILVRYELHLAEIPKLERGTVEYKFGTFTEFGVKVERRAPSKRSFLAWTKDIHAEAFDGAGESCGTFTFVAEKYGFRLWLIASEKLFKDLPPDAALETAQKCLADAFARESLEGKTVSAILFEGDLSISDDELKEGMLL